MSALTPPAGTPVRSPRAVLFDLDGTLLDTAPDLATATNSLREQHGLAPLPFAAIRPHVSHGGTALTRLALGVEPHSAGFDEARSTLLDLYRAALHHQTQLFEGMEHCLGQLEALGLAWGVVTNKPGWLTDPLMAALGLDRRAACVVSGDTTAERKPHPLPLLHACTLLGLQPSDCIYLGDAERDIEAARAAGIPGLVAGWGYLGAEDDPTAWQAEALLEHPHALLSWLGGLEPRPGRS
jgi:N-acetyl-D-muramate 6-phosphate phosphatase